MAWRRVARPGPTKSLLAGVFSFKGHLIDEPMRAIIPRSILDPRSGAKAVRSALEQAASPRYEN
jgi:hypothetical protein